MARQWKLLALYALALTAGILTAAILVAAYTYIDGWNAARAAQVDGSHLLIPLDVQVGIAASFALYYALIVLVCCVPIWLWLMRRDLATVWAAAALGYLSTATLWVLTNLTGHSTIGELIGNGFPYAICGAIAGVATWWARPRVAPDVR
jgi:hypothetical protein